MSRWLDDQKTSIQVIEPITEKTYFFQPRRSDSTKGYIKVKCNDGITRSVTGSVRNGMFFANPRGKNALVILTQEMIDLQLGTTISTKPEPLLTVDQVEDRYSQDETIEELDARLERMYGLPPTD